MPALLLEHRRREPREEDGVHVDVHEVVEVRQVGGGHRVARAVGVGEGVDEGVERGLDELHEGLLHGVLARAAQHAVLEDVRHARRVGHRRAEDDAEDLVVIVRIDRELLMDESVQVVRPPPSRVAPFVAFAL